MPSVVIIINDVHKEDMTAEGGLAAQPSQIFVFNTDQVPDQIVDECRAFELSGNIRKD